MSYAIPADEPGSAAPAALSLLVHGVLFAVLVFGLRWQSKLPDPVVAELWSELPEIQPPEPKVEPKPEIKPQPKPDPRVEQKQSKPDIATVDAFKKATNVDVQGTAAGLQDGGSPSPIFPNRAFPFSLLLR